MRSVTRRYPIRTLLPLLGALLFALLTGCDAPLQPDKLLNHLGKGDYTFFSVTFYRYPAAEMQSFALGLAGGQQYAYEQMLLQGPLERLDFTYRPKNKSTTITRFGNDLDVEHQLTSIKKAPNRGPLDEVIKLIKGNPEAMRGFFSRDVYATADETSPDYFRAVDNAVLSALRRQHGSTPEWQFVEFTLQYKLPQAGKTVLTSESALIPLGSGAGALIDGPLQSIADKHFAALPDPLKDREY